MPDAQTMTELERLKFECDTAATELAVIGRLYDTATQNYSTASRAYTDALMARVD